MNSVVLIGRLTRDPELQLYRRHRRWLLPPFTIAIDRPVRAGGEKQTDFPRVTVFGKQAENCEKYLCKRQTGRRAGKTADRQLHRTEDGGYCLYDRRCGGQSRILGVGGQAVRAVQQGGSAAEAHLLQGGYGQGSKDDDAARRKCRLHSRQSTKTFHSNRKGDKCNHGKRDVAAA